MKKFLFILVVAFSLFFILYILNQIVELSLHIEWIILMVWLGFVYLLSKTLFKEDGIVSREENQQADRE